MNTMEAEREKRGTGSTLSPDIHVWMVRGRGLFSTGCTVSRDLSLATNVEGVLWSEMMAVSDREPLNLSILDPSPRPDRRARYRHAADLLRQWMQEPDDYDERVWPAVEEALKDSGLRLREEGE